MSQEPLVTLPKLNVRPQTDFKALPERKRPGGSSADLQFFKEVSSKKLWIGKCGNNAMSLLQARVPYHAHYYEEYKEWLGLMLYRLLGVDVPQIVLSEQLPEKPTELVPDIFDYEHPCLHVMLEFVEGFRTYGEGFLDNYRKMATGKKNYATVTSPMGDAVPLQGFGATLAVACFLYDLDCLGRSGGNMGYVISTDKAGKPVAKTIKIDSGFAFSFLEDFDDTSYNHDPRQRDVRFAPGKMAGGQVCLIRYEELSLADQAEFAQAARRILQVPRSQFKAVIDQVVAPDGFTQQQADRVLNELLARKSTFLNGFAPEVSSQLKAEVKVAREAVLAGLLSKTISSPPISLGWDSKHRTSQPTSSQSTPSRDKTPTATLSNSSSTSSSAVLSVVRSEVEFDSDEGEVMETKPGRTSTLVARPSVPPFDDSPTSVALTASPTATTQSLVETKESKSLREVSDAEMVLLAQQAAAESHTIRLTAQLEKERIKGEKKEGKPDAKTACQVFQKPMVTPYFAGREALLATIAKQLYSDQGSVITQGISGLGGVGKTQLAARYAQLASEDATCGEQRLQYQAVIWLNAEHHLDVQFLMLAEAWCHQTGLKPEEAVAVVYRYLQTKRTLLVFDNAVDAASLALFLPPSTNPSFVGRFQRALASTHLHILITSRHADWPTIPTLSVNGFSVEEATAFVRQRLPTATAEQINALLDTVSTLPLALSHAVAYIAAGHSTLTDYPKQFALHQLSLGGTTTQTDASHTVLTTFLLTLFRIKQQHPVVMPILQACAYLAPDGIPITWLETALAGPATAKGGYQLGKYPLPVVQAGLAALQRHALLQSDKAELLAMHRLLQQVIRHQLTPAEQQTQSQRVLRWLTAANPDEGGNHAADQARRAFLPHLEVVITHREQNLGDEGGDLAIALAQVGGIYLYLLDQPAKSRELLERALTIDEAHYGREHYAVTSTLANLGNAYGDLGEAWKKRELLERALRIQEAHYGREHYQVAKTLTNLGNVYGVLGEVGKQRELLERALRIQEAHYGREHYAMAATLTNLGNAYGDLGEVGKQRELLERALRIQEAHYGREHYQVAMTLANLGNAYGDLGQSVKSCELLERALAIKEAHYGREHYQVAATLANLGNAYGALGKVGKARDVLERALQIEEAHYGCKHPELAITLTNLALAYHILKQPQTALPTAQRVYRILMSHPHYGAAHPRTKQCLKVLQSRCGFTLTTLQSSISVVEKQKSAVSSHTTTTSPASSSTAQLLSQQGLTSRGVQQAQQRLGQAVLALVTAINSQRQASWDAQAHISFTATIVSAFAKGKEAFQQLCAQPELHSIPVELGKFVQTYVRQRPELQELSTYLDFARGLKNDLIQGRLEELYARFGVPKPEQKAAAIGSNQKESTCLVM